MEIQKAYFTIQEILARWGIPETDLIYLAENDRLRLSVRVFNLPMEFGDIEEVPEGAFRMPYERSRYSGLLDLAAAEAFRLFRCGETEVTYFRAAQGSYAEVQDDAGGLFVAIGDLLLRREERDRFEAEMARTNAGPISGMFSVSNGYQEVRCDGIAFRLGAIQAEVVRILHEAALAGDPWQDGKTILQTAGSRSLKMSDVFKSQKQWRRLIQSNQRGQYRLNHA